MPKHTKYKYLAHLLGPKAENENFLASLISRTLLDYAHWRRNYFPSDPQIISPALQRANEGETENILHEVNRMLAGLRRSFPFYSPRYIAHQQSETTISSIVGTFAGLLYNSNNVTPESGAVTVEWEIEACNAVLRMLGMRPPPDPPIEPSHEQYQQYKKELESEFAWCHLTSGGTVANIEALWVARAVRYFPLAVRDVCIAHNLPVMVKTPNMIAQPGSPDAQVRISSISPYGAVGLKPNESIFLLGRLVSEIHRKLDCPLDVASKTAWKWLKESPYSPSGGIAKAIADFPPVILVSGAAHYSIEKAADILGLGRDAVERVDMDGRCRLDMESLSAKLHKAISKRRCILAVVAIAGTTEEGAVDPTHRILELREKIERENNQSFWLHVDAAWGGFIRSVFVEPAEPPPPSVSLILLEKRLFDIARELEITLSQDGKARDWVLEALTWIAAKRNVDAAEIEAIPATVDGWFAECGKKAESGRKETDYEPILSQMRHLLARWKAFDGGSGVTLDKNDFRLSIYDRLAAIKDENASEMEIELTLNPHEYKRKIKLTWPTDDVGLAFFAMGEADSVTVDPHKMGYTVYPCGAIAFKNDRVRHFVRQEAPYITSTKPNFLAHMPLRRSIETNEKLGPTRIKTEAFAPFTLEGSRPSSSACSLWLASRTLPFDKHHHGTMVAASILAARSLYEWLRRWNDIARSVRLGAGYEFVPFSTTPPDTNIVIFGVKPKSSDFLPEYNKLTTQTYEHFAIQAERGERDHSYSQPFFLSNTTFSADHYPLSCVESFMKRCDFVDPRSAYEENGIAVLRATVASPYIIPTKDLAERDIIREFVREMHQAAETSL